MEGGTAERDNRLRVGDRLVHVNHIPVYNQSLEFSVEQLISIPLGSVAVIGVKHPLPGSSPEVICSPLSRESLLGEGDEYNMAEYGDSLYIGEGTQSTVVGGMESRHTQDVRLGLGGL